MGLVYLRHWIKFMKITLAKAYAVLDSRGVPTVAVYLQANGQYAVGMSPSGASTGSHEAYEWRDGEQAFAGKSVDKAVNFFNEKLAQSICEKDWEGCVSFDQWLIETDGSANFQNIGGNLAIAASIAFLRIASLVHGFEPYAALRNEFGFEGAKPVVTPMINVINGGKHASSGLAIQEIMIVPVIGDSSTEKIMIGAEIFSALKKVMIKRHFSTLVGDEGGFAPVIEHASEAFDLIAEACDSAGYRFGDDIKLALDVAATEVYREGKYHLEGMAMDAATMVDFYESLVKKSPIISIEDPFAEDDFAAWKLLQERIGQQVQIVGDDLTVTNVQRMALVQNQKLVSAMIVKPNQIGTITQTMNAIKLANQYGWRTIISHRSGETEDTTIADIAYAVGSPYIKTGSCSRSERLAKYNRLIWLEQIV